VVRRIWCARIRLTNKFGPSLLRKSDVVWIEKLKQINNGILNANAPRARMRDLSTSPSAHHNSAEGLPLPITGCLRNPGQLIPTPFLLTPRWFVPDDMEVHAEASSNTSLAALIPDSTAPSIHACVSEVCSPAKWIRSWDFHTFSNSSCS
jgi:hypothetical protein